RPGERRYRDGERGLLTQVYVAVGLGRLADHRERAIHAEPSALHTGLRVLPSKLAHRSERRDFRGVELELEIARAVEVRVQQVRLEAIVEARLQRLGGILVEAHPRLRVVAEGRFLP